MADIVKRCLELIRFAPDCEDAGDFVMEAIELAKELEASVWPDGLRSPESAQEIVRDIDGLKILSIHNRGDGKCTVMVRFDGDGHIPGNVAETLQKAIGEKPRINVEIVAPLRKSEEQRFGPPHKLVKAGEVAGVPVITVKGGLITRVGEKLTADDFEVEPEMVRSLERGSMADCERCLGLGKIPCIHAYTGPGSLRRGVCPDCGGSGKQPFTVIEGTRYQVRDLHVLKGEIIETVQVREDAAVVGYGHAAYQVLIETKDGKVISIAGDHDSGPDITVLEDMPPIPKDEEWW